jgi:hypothetical protein
MTFIHCPACHRITTELGSRETFSRPCGTGFGLGTFIFSCSSRPESCQEHLLTSIAEVLRLRALKLSVCDRSAQRFAQDDGFVGGLKYKWWISIEKVTGSPNDKEEGGCFQWELV